MRVVMTLITGGLAGLALAACTPAEEPRSTSAQARGRECFRAQDVNSFSPVGEDAVNVAVGASRYFRLELIGPCPDIDWSRSVALRTRGPSWICGGHDADVIVPGPLGAQTCPVHAVRRLTEAEVAAFHAERR